MTTHVSASFVIDQWDEHKVLDAQTKFTRTTVKKTFSGGIVGTSLAELVMAGANKDWMAYSGFETLDVSIDGKKGTFALNHNAWHSPQGGHAAWTVIAGSGTGELTGLRGTATIARHDDGSHTFALEYDLG